MPGVNPPVNEKFYQEFLQMQRDIVAIATQQQLSFTNADAKVIITLGLVPGSNPPTYGLQLIDPATGKQLVFVGDDSSGNGALQMTSEGGIPVLFAGTEPLQDGSGRLQQVFQLWRDDGSAALQLSDNGKTPGHTHQQDLAWFDRNGNVVLADDTVSGTGIARPHLQGPYLANTNVSTWPGTNSTSWTSIANGYMECQQPQLQWSWQLFAPAGVTGEFKLMVAGAQIGSTQTVVGGSSGNFVQWSDLQPWPAAATFGSMNGVTLYGMVTAGSGTIAAQQLLLQGVQS